MYFGKIFDLHWNLINVHFTVTWLLVELTPLLFLFNVFMLLLILLILLRLLILLILLILLSLLRWILFPRTCNGGVSLVSNDFISEMHNITFTCFRSQNNIQYVFERTSAQRTAVVLMSSIHLFQFSSRSLASCKKWINIFKIMIWKSGQKVP